ncbi:MAG: hypothetical protein ABI440_02145, partial [Casimicrobiaceae bacterium]
MVERLGRRFVQAQATLRASQRPPRAAFADSIAELPELRDGEHGLLDRLRVQTFAKLRLGEAKVAMRHERQVVRRA